MGLSERHRVWLDLLNGAFGVIAGLLIVANAAFGLQEVAGFGTPLVAMGLLGTGFAAVGLGHLSLGDTRTGMAESTAGVGAIFLGLSFTVRPQVPLFVVGAVALLAGGVVLLVEQFDLGG